MKYSNALISKEKLVVLSISCEALLTENKPIEKFSNLYNNFSSQHQRFANFQKKICAKALQILKGI